MNELVRDQLPLRRRGTLEIFDVSLKLFKRYFVPLIVWSLVASLANFISLLLPGVGWAVAVVLAPIGIGSVGCCLAAAVHGRDITTRECWNFLSKRYGSVLVVYLVSGLVTVALVFAVAIIIGVLTYFAIAVFAPLLSSDITAILGVAGIIVVSLCASVLMACLFAWTGMVPLALCLEGNGKDNTRFLRRTYELMRGHWWRIFGLVSIVGLAIIGLAVILMGLASMVIGIATLKEVTSGQISPESITRLTAGYIGSFSLISILWSPFYYLALGVQYLDLRVRKEALDLEWAAQEHSIELV